MAIRHLIKLGHTHIGEISGPRNWHEALIRHETFLATLAAHALTPAVMVEASAWMPQAGYEAALRLLEQNAPFSALVAGNDYLALGAILALTERGIRVPEDVSIVGFDDTPEAAFFRPPLTTVRQDYEAMGKQSIQYLMELINNPDTPVYHRILTPEFIERASTQPYSGDM